MKNIIILVLSVLLVGALMAVQHVTERLDAASNYINALETDYPDFIDTTSGSDAYSEWYAE